MSELPTNWCFATLGDVIDGFEAGRNLKALGRPPEEAETGVLKVSAVTWGTFDPRESKALLPADEAKPHELIREGDLLVSRANTTELVGAAVLVDRDHPQLMLPDKILRLLYKREAVEPGYLLQALRTTQVRDYFRREATGTSDSMRNVSQPKFRAVPLPLPPLNEQRRIVAKVDALMAKSRRAKQALDAIPPLLDKLRQSILAAAFRGDLTADWRAAHPNTEPASELLKRIRTERRHRWEQAELRKLQAKGKPPKDDRWKAKYKEPAPVDTEGLPELPEGWVWASVETLAVDGPTNGTSPAAAADAEGTPTLKLSATSTGRCVLDASTTKRTVRSLPQDTPFWLVPGDLLVQRANSLDYVGVSVVFEGPAKTFVYPDLMMRLRIANLVGPQLLWLALSTPDSRRFMRERATGTAGNMPKINGATLRALPIPLAPMDEAEKLVALVSGAYRLLDGLLDRSRESERSLATVNVAILAKAFRGELVPQDPNDEPASALLERLRSEGEAVSKPVRRRKKRQRAG